MSRRPVTIHTIAVSIALTWSAGAWSAGVWVSDTYNHRILLYRLTGAP
jgi:hypothetical protein